MVVLFLETLPLRKENYCADNQVTNFMEWSPSWKANSSSDGHEILRIVWNPKVHYRVQKTLQLAHILCQINPVRAGPTKPSRSRFKGSIQVRAVFEQFIKC
jgi:hypothetical protein